MIVKTKNTSNAKCSEGYRTTGILRRYQWVCKLVRRLEKILCQWYSFIFWKCSHAFDILNSISGKRTRKPSSHPLWIQNTAYKNDPSQTMSLSPEDRECQHFLTVHHENNLVTFKNIKQNRNDQGTVHMAEMIMVWEIFISWGTRQMDGEIHVYSSNFTKYTFWHTAKWPNMKINICQSQTLLYKGDCWETRKNLKCYLKNALWLQFYY